MKSRLTRDAARIAAWTAPWLAGPAWSQVLTGTAEPAQPAPWRVVAAFALCVLLAAGAAVALKARLGDRAAGPAPLGRKALWSLVASARPAGASRRLEAIETVKVGEQLELCLFACDGQEFLVAVSPHGLLQLDRGTWPQTGRGA